MRLMQLWLGAAGVQRLIDAGVYITWVEKNGLEMLAEFTREVTGSRKQTSSFTATRVRFLFLCTRVCVCLMCLRILFIWLCPIVLCSILENHDNGNEHSRHRTSLKTTGRVSPASWQTFRPLSSTTRLLEGPIRPPLGVAVVSLLRHHMSRFRLWMSTLLQVRLVRVVWSITS
jgi:hypothetical protein